MKLLEYQAHELLAEFDIRSPESSVAFDAESAVRILNSIGSRVAIKAQIPSGGRGKAGGVVFAETSAQAEKAAESLLSMDIRGFPVEALLVQRAVEISREMFISISIDRTARSPVILVSPIGGVDIEELSNDIRRFPIDPLTGMTPYKSRAIARILHVAGDIHVLQKIVENLYSAFVELDAVLVEVNPLALDSTGRYLALDAKIILEDCTIDKHPELAGLNREEASDERKKAEDIGISYIPLEGEIGCIVNGAGLAMATMDTIQSYGANPANFLDIGGSSSSRKMEIALDLLLKVNGLKIIIINIFGGITRCDEIAEGIRSFISKRRIDIPIFARLMGTNSETADKILNECHIRRFETMEELIRSAVSYIKEVV